MCVPMEAAGRGLRSWLEFLAMMVLSAVVLLLNPALRRTGDVAAKMERSELLRTVADAMTMYTMETRQTSDLAYAVAVDALRSGRADPREVADVEDDFARNEAAFADVLRQIENLRGVQPPDPDRALLDEAERATRDAVAAIATCRQILGMMGR